MRRVSRVWNLLLGGGIVCVCVCAVWGCVSQCMRECEWMWLCMWVGVVKGRGALCCVGEY